MEWVCTLVSKYYQYIGRCLKLGIKQQYDQAEGGEEMQNLKIK